MFIFIIVATVKVRTIGNL